MTLALLADIHANRQALSAVLADALSHGCTRVAVLGDIIGFGGEPEWCARQMRECAAVAVRGNHEAALASPALFAPFPAVQRMTERTRRLLPQQLLHWLTELPFTAELPGLVLSHAGFHAPQHWGRLREAAEAAASFTAQQAPLAFFGHTHRPTVFCRHAGGGIDQLPIVYDTSGSWSLVPRAGCRYLINPGSVGQPRDGDPRAAWALWDGRVLTLRRVPYDVETAAAGILSMGLPASFTEALRRGVSPL